MTAEPRPDAPLRDKVTVDGKPYRGPTVDEVLATPEGDEAVREALERMREEDAERHAE